MILSNHINRCHEGNLSKTPTTKSIMHYQPHECDMNELQAIIFDTNYATDIESRTKEGCKSLTLR